MKISTAQKKALFYSACGQAYAYCHTTAERNHRERTLQALERKGLLSHTAGRWEPTQAGENYIQDRQRSHT